MLKLPIDWGKGFLKFEDYFSPEFSITLYFCPKDYFGYFRIIIWTQSIMIRWFYVKHYKRLNQLDKEYYSW